MAESNKINKTLRELLDMEEALKIICRKYENDFRINGYDGNTDELFQKYNKKYQVVFEEIRKFIDKNE